MKITQKDRKFKEGSGMQVHKPELLEMSDGDLEQVSGGSSNLSLEDFKKIYGGEKAGTPIFIPKLPST